MKKEWHMETLAVQAGYQPKDGDPRIVPIVQSTGFKFSRTEHVAQLFDLEVPGHFYSRVSNPTVEALEERICALEGGAAALATSSGQAATTTAVLNICHAGDHLVASSALYGGSYSLFANTLPKLGVEVSFVEPDADREVLERAFRSNTKALFGEVIGNPGLNVLDFEKFAAVAAAKGVPLMVDNTFTTPYLCLPLSLGAHIVTHSASKYLDGHACSVGGVIVDGGRFNWDNGKYPAFSEPDESYHGLRFSSFKEKAYIVKARAQLMRDMGACLAPLNAYLINLGMETLPLRMQRHSDNALALARFLESHRKVSWVRYPGLESHTNHELAKRYLTKGAGGMLTFGVKGGGEAGRKFIESCELVALVIHLGDARSCALHPASTTHRQLSPEQQRTCGVSEDMIRFSVGIEHIDDLIADVDQALSRI